MSAAQRMRTRSTIDLLAREEPEPSTIRTLADFQRAVGAGADRQGLVGEAGIARVVRSAYSAPGRNA